MRIMRAQKLHRSVDHDQIFFEDLTLKLREPNFFTIITIYSLLIQKILEIYCFCLFCLFFRRQSPYIFSPIF